MSISHIDSLAMQAVVPSILQREWALEYGLIFIKSCQKTTFLIIAWNIYGRISMHAGLLWIFVIFKS